MTEYGAELSAEGTTFVFPRLIYSGSRAKRYWQVKVRLLRDGHPQVIVPENFKGQLDGMIAEIMVESGQLHGKCRETVPTWVSTGKNLGKKNATNALTQALRDAKSMSDRTAKRAGIEAEAPEDPGAVRGPPLPQLVRRQNESKASTITAEDWASGITVQRKLNGVRLVAYLAPSGKVVTYSRTGTEYPESAEVSAALGEILRAAPVSDDPYLKGPPYLDGELYTHGMSLNKIVGRARRAEDVGGLSYNVFDVFFPEAKAAGFDAPSRIRQEYLDNLHIRPPVVRVENFKATSQEELNALVEKFLAEGYEGGIARRDSAGYQYSNNGYHSPNVLKIKPVHDAEYPVVGFTEGSTGKDVGAIVWICRVESPVDPRDDTFHVVPKNITLAHRRQLYSALKADDDLFRREFLGKPLTVEYAEISAKTGKPLQAKALAFRTYDSLPGDDPVSRVIGRSG